jgi:hypothetical protein
VDERRGPWVDQHLALDVRPTPTGRTRRAFGGANPLPTAQDDAAVAADKDALLPGHQGGFANLSSYTRGINGVMVDVLNLGAAVTAADFDFKVGNVDDPATWAAGPAPDVVVVRRGGGAGGSDRVTLVWPDGAIRNAWLQVNVRANANTGLQRPDVFYFGSLVGEVGDGTSAPALTGGDVVEIRRALARSGAAVNSRFDVNRDGRVDAPDVAAVLGAAARRATVRAIQVPAPPGASGVGGDATVPGRRRQPFVRAVLG